MNTSHSSIHPLGNDRVRSLLALGLLPEAVPDTQNTLDMIREAVNDPAGTKARSLLADLESPVLASQTGPLSFVRLTGIELADAESIGDRSFLRALASSRTTIKVLQALVEYGELLASSVFPAETQLTGALIRTLAQAALLRRHSDALSRVEAESMSAILRALAATPTIPKALRDSASKSIVALDNSSKGN